MGAGIDEVFSDLQHEWLGITWDLAMEQMVGQENELRRAGLWRTGERTLLAQIGLALDEVRMCRAVAWLLTPDGWHGLGSRFLEVLLEDLGLPTSGAPGARVALEEVRATTRADIIVRSGDQTVVFEAKILAGEQDGQADRIAEHWSAESPTFVYLTPSGATPDSALDSRDLWIPLTWTRLGQLARIALHDTSTASHGALELIDTLERFGETP
ncbi:PD-(D/E)XK nuclease family protein [Granulicoccus sp. GXG6511]|uniref:PD-(D/E)XK nuclease family protein n=1 Tax=Granulicoccus sp. GXG6511 TaxID=3381351 RepID=UPI003D7DC492